MRAFRKALMFLSAIAALHAPAAEAFGPPVWGGSGVGISTIPVPINQGGTGATTAGGALGNLTGATGNYGQYLVRTGTGTWQALPNYQTEGNCYFGDYMAVSGTAKPTTPALQVAAQQNWLLDCELKALSFQTSVSTNSIAERTYIRAIYPRGGAFVNETNHIDSPLVVPEYTAFDDRDQVRRDETTGGTPTSFWTGDDTAKALSGLNVPAVLVVPHGHLLGDLNIQAKSGSNGGAGVGIGKAWVPAAGTGVITFTSCGNSNYANGQVLDLPNPSAAPYTTTKITITANTAGCPTAATVTTQGSWSLPPVLAQTLYNSAGWNSLYVSGIAAGNIGQVFDPLNPTWYITNAETGSGTGAEVTIGTWVQDFVSGTFAGDYGLTSGATVQADTMVEHVSVQQCGTTGTSGDGNVGCVILGGLNYDIGPVTTTGGTIGIYLQGVADIHGGWFNPVNATTGIKIAAGGSIKFGFECDTPSKDCMEIDDNQTTQADGYCINVGGALTGSGTIVIGGDTNYSGTNKFTTNLDLKLNTNNCGGSGVPAVFIDYSNGGNHIDITDSNSTKNSTGAASQPNTLFATFGTHNNSIGRLTGTFDQISGNPFSGTVPNEGIEVYDSALGGYVLGDGMCNMSGSGAPTNGGSGTGLNVCGPGSTYKDYTNAYIYVNVGTASSLTWVPLSSAGSVVSYTSHGTHSFTVPPGVTSAVACGRGAGGGGGGGGGGAGGSTATSGGGGGAGGNGGSTITFCVPLALTPGDTLSLVIGTGGTGGNGGVGGQPNGGAGGSGTAGGTVTATTAGGASSITDTTASTQLANWNGGGAGGNGNPGTLAGAGTAGAAGQGILTLTASTSGGGGAAGAAGTGGSGNNSIARSPFAASPATCGAGGTIGTGGGGGGCACIAYGDYTASPPTQASCNGGAGGGTGASGGYGNGGPSGTPTGGTAAGTGVAGGGGLGGGGGGGGALLAVTGTTGGTGGTGGLGSDGQIILRW